MTAPAQVQIPPGMVVITTFGSIRHESAQCWMESRAACDREGLTNIAWAMVPGGLVDKARNDSVRQALRAGAQWLLFLDGDMTWEPDLVKRMLIAAYGEVPHADVLGGYCSLRGDIALPTIDTGTGTWESIYPGRGPVEVMRTGAACLLVKRHVFERIPEPWFALRVPKRPLDAIAEFDNFCRVKLHGENPFRAALPELWQHIERAAADDPSAAPGQFVPGEVGEDSGFCDRVRLHGLRIFVHTDIILGHVETRVTNWTHHREKMREHERTLRQAAGLAA